MLTIRVRETGDEQAKGLARRIREKAPALKCSACGRSDFALLEEPQANLRTRLYRHLEGGVIEDAPQHLSQKLVTLLCTSCGHLEQFGQAVLDGVDPERYGAGVDG